MDNVAELGDVAAWAAADAGRRKEVIGQVLTRLLGFELAYIKTYAAPEDTRHRSLPIATLRQTATSILFNLIPGGTYTMGFSERQEQALWDAVEQGKASGDIDDLYAAEDILLDSGAMRPAHRVHVAPFLLARFPLWVEQAACILGVDPEDEEVPRMEDLELAGFVEEGDALSFLRGAGYFSRRSPSGSTPAEQAQTLSSGGATGCRRGASGSRCPRQQRMRRTGSATRSGWSAWHPTRNCAPTSGTRVTTAPPTMVPPGPRSRTIRSTSSGAAWRRITPGRVLGSGRGCCRPCALLARGANWASCYDRPTPCLRRRDNYVATHTPPPLPDRPSSCRGGMHYLGADPFIEAVGLGHNGLILAALKEELERFRDGQSTHSATFLHGCDLILRHRPLETSARSNLYINE
jgi:hypothetical protein